MFIIAGHYRRQSLVSPKGSQTRPTASRLRESLFNICQQSIEGAHFLDLFAGSGAMGLEALSRGAQFATFVDSHKESFQCIESNIQHLKVKDQTQLLRGDVLAILKKLHLQEKTFDIIYADPPYQTYVPHSTHFYSSSIVQWLDDFSLLKPGGTLFIEEDFQAQPQLEHLNHLKLIDSRRMGKAALQQYRYL